MWVLPVLAFQPAPRASCAAVASVPLPFRGGVVLARSLPLEVEEVVAAAFRKQYPPAKIAALWTELKAERRTGASGSARQSTDHQPVLHGPAKAARRLEIMSRRDHVRGGGDRGDAEEPSGAAVWAQPSLDTGRRDQELRQLRYYGGRLVPNPTAALAVVVAALFYVVAGSYVGDVTALDTIKPVLGFVGAGLFGATLYGVASSSRRKS